MKSSFNGVLFAAALSLSATTAFALDAIVEKKTFEMPSYTTVGGKVIKQVRIGYETYGKLNAAGDNAILVPHFFSANSHVAGKYKADDKQPGYWDAIVGPGKPLDTDKYFIIGVDSLSNINTKDGITVTTGPASINPDTGKPYALTFPIVRIRDFVNTQKALMDALGVKKLHAVMGASMGAQQSYEWAAAYPDMVQRLIPVIGSAHSDGWVIAMMQTWADPVRLDPNWKQGNYYGGPEPIDGLTLAFKMVNRDARQPAWADGTFGRKIGASGDPAQDLNARYALEEWQDAASRARAAASDANNFLYLTRAVQLHALDGAATVAEGLKKVKAKTLLLPDHRDMLLLTEYSRAERDILKAQGVLSGYRELQGTLGHLDGVVAISQASEEIAKFLSE
jgi:homoserine O-acetyltransferase